MGDATMVFSNDTSTAGVAESSSAVPWMDNSTFTAASTEAGPMSKSLQTYQERVVIAVLWLLIALIDIIGNTMVILAVVFSRKLRTSTNVFVVSLSVADLLTGLALPMSAVGLLSPGDTWPWSTETPCYLAGMLLYISSWASLYNLASIALNRLILIKRPMTLYHSLYTRRNLAINVAVLWFVAIAIMVVPPLCGVGGFGYDEQHHTCSDLDTHRKAKTFEKIQTFLGYPIPLIIIVTSYTLIYLHVRRHFKAQRSLRGGISTSDTGPVSSSSRFQVSDNAAVSKTSQQGRAYRQQLQITKNLFMAVCAFFVCITPYCVALFIPNTDRYLLFLGVVFTCNSCVNPIIYASKHPQFKKVLRQMLQCKYSQIEEPSDALKALMTCCYKA
ncbi:5-hydroxytryptamine receptor 2A-like [Patiria miniata]|uniref:G-protein coupled receptors family 1 profile domain-containing protein n=1 Tax=Patiria miniata TaxID=46514 RepID=A0A913ZTI5_PATMI|nr:5-hydroxytryptamine receptor 2A-like [Patiria miniata]XP_038055073.1 5-hydroxytryptamine receptor 2A-like [Patiria miniata]